MKTQKQTKRHSALREAPEFLKVRQAVERAWENLREEESEILDPPPYLRLYLVVPREIRVSADLGYCRGHAVYFPAQGIVVAQVQEEGQPELLALSTAYPLPSLMWERFGAPYRAAVLQDLFKALTERLREALEDSYTRGFVADYKLLRERFEGE